MIKPSFFVTEPSQFHIFIGVLFTGVLNQVKEGLGQWHRADDLMRREPLYQRKEGEGQFIRQRRPGIFMFGPDGIGPGDGKMPEAHLQ